MSLSAFNVQEIALKLAPWANLSLWERAYSLPSRDWLNGEFAHHHFSNHGNYKLNSWDCNNLAIEAAMMARKSHALNSDKLTGLAFGWAFFVLENQTTGVQYDPSKQHCVNWVICGKPGEELNVFWEPQRSYEISLTTNEINSITDLFM